MNPTKLIILSEKNAGFPLALPNVEFEFKNMDIIDYNTSEICFFNPDVIVFDIKRMDTIPQSLTNLLKNQLLANLPVVFTFYDFSKKSYTNALKCGAIEVIFHPIEKEYFLSKIKSIAQAINNCKTAENSLSMNKVSHFIRKAIEIIKQHLNNPYFSVEDLADHMALSRVQLYRNIKKDTNKSVSEFIRCVRLNAAIQMMRNDRDRISEIAYKVGFENPSYFTSCFKREFGITPSQYLN